MIDTKSIEYSSAAVKRAERALCCSPFQLSLLTAMAKGSVSLGEIAGSNGWEKGYTKKVISAMAVERSLMWLIEVGLLRREVDGQGITDSFRLTPLGQQLRAKWEELGGSQPEPTGRERLQNTLTRFMANLIK
ncbi:MAG: hypothetical protein GDA44_07365 [Prochloron sp. SP5CPC1]|nr:hypothetical protein [Candidatus Paraprochloron terpiosi SP5CPC1]